MNRVNDHTPELGVTILIKTQRRRLTIKGHQPQMRRCALQAPEQKGAAMGTDDVTTGPGLDTAIDHQEIPMKDAGSRHGIAAGPHEEGAGRRGDQQIMEIDLALDVVIGGAGESGRHRLQGQRQRPPGSMAPEGKRRLGIPGEGRITRTPRRGGSDRGEGSEHGRPSQRQCDNTNELPKWLSHHGTSRGLGPRIRRPR